MDGTITINWEDAAGDLSSFEVAYINRDVLFNNRNARWLVDDVSYADAVNNQTGGFSYTVDGLTVGETYFFKVYHVKNDGSQGDFMLVVETSYMPTVPNAPSNLTATSGRWIKLEWEAPEEVVGAPIIEYAYRWSSNDGVAWQSNSSPGGWVNTGSTETRIQVEDLAIGTEYVFQVRAKNAIGNSANARRAIETQRRNYPPFRKGVNFTRWLGRPKTDLEILYTKQDFYNVKSIGIDHIRIVMQPQFDSSDSVEPWFLDKMEIIIDWAEEVGIYVIFCNVNNADHTVESMEDYMLNLWPQIATRFVNRSNFVVYELMNEPGVDLNEKDWADAQESAVIAIRNIDPNKTLVVSPHAFSPESLSTLSHYKADNLVYTYHYYRPKRFVHQSHGENETWGNSSDVAEMQRVLQKAANFSHKYNVPIWCGEYGVVRTFAPRQDRANWYREMSTFMGDNDIAWCIFEWKTGEFDVFEIGGDDGFHRDLNVSVIDAVGLNEPQQRENVVEAITSGFYLYQDATSPGVEFYARSKAWVSQKNTDTAHAGSKSIYWSDEPKKGKIGFNFRPNVDLTSLEDTHMIEFWVWCDTPGESFNLRIVEKHDGTENNPPWEVRKTIDQELAGLQQWDSDWHRIAIPLSDFEEPPSIKIPGILLDTYGAFSFSEIDKIVLSSDGHSGATFRIDDFSIRRIR